MEDNYNQAAIRVLHVVTIMNPGGIETMLMNIYRNINRKKIQFDFLVHRLEKGVYDDEIISMGGMIYHIIPVRLCSIIKYKKMLDYFFSNHYYSIVHSHISILSYLILKSAGKHGATVRISHSHQINAFLGFKSLIRIPVKIYCKMKIKGVSTRLMACSNSAGYWLFGKKAPFLVINNAIDTHKFIYNSTIRRRMRNEFNLASDTLVIGHVGSFQKVKNHLYLLQIFKIVHETDPEAILMMVGDGVLRAEIEKTAKRLDLQQNVIFTGIRSDVSKLLQVMDVFVLPSISEGLPVTLIEAQASGLPCLVSDVVTKEVAITELVTFLPLTKSPEIWAEKMLTLTEGSERRNMRSEIIKKGYDVNTTSEWITNFYIEELKRYYLF